MDALMLVVFLLCFGSTTLLVLWCASAAVRKER